MELLLDALKAVVTQVWEGGATIPHTAPAPGAPDAAGAGEAGAAGAAGGKQQRRLPVIDGAAAIAAAAAQRGGRAAASLSASAPGRSRSGSGGAGRELAILEKLGGRVGSGAAALRLGDALAALISARSGAGKGGAKLDERGLGRAMAALAALWGGAAPAAEAECGQEGGGKVAAGGEEGGEKLQIDEERMHRCGGCVAGVCGMGWWKRGRPTQKELKG